MDVNSLFYVLTLFHPYFNMHYITLYDTFAISTLTILSFLQSPKLKNRHFFNFCSLLHMDDDVVNRHFESSNRGHLENGDSPPRRQSPSKTGTVPLEQSPSGDPCHLMVLSDVSGQNGDSPPRGQNGDSPPRGKDLCAKDATQGMDKTGTTKRGQSTSDKTGTVHPGERICALKMQRKAL